MEFNVQSMLKESIEKGLPYAELRSELRRVVAAKDYENRVLSHCILHQWAYQRCSSDVKRTCTEREYYVKMMQTCRENCLMYPYKFDIEVLQCTGIMPFTHYREILNDMVKSEKSYDTLPNFTAVDCLRLTGIGRNQYIDIMNRVKAKKMFRLKGPRVLPTAVRSDFVLEPWWNVMIIATPERINRECTPREIEVLDTMRREHPQPLSAPSEDGTNASIGGGSTPDSVLSGALDRWRRTFSNSSGSHQSSPHKEEMRGECLACVLPKPEVISLYRKGILYSTMPIMDNDTVVVPPLNNMVMNRTTSDPFEKLLYDILVSIDERTTIKQLSAILDKDLEDIRNAVSVYCRLGMAHKTSCASLLRALMDQGRVHNQWHGSPIDKYLNGSVGATAAGVESGVALEPTVSSQAEAGIPSEFSDQSTGLKRMAFVFDAELTAYLMMGNLGELKDHAVTLFEAGKMTDELLDLLDGQLSKVDNTGKEGEVKKYFDHAVALGFVLRILRKNESINIAGCDGRLDLVRSESLNSLDPFTKRRILDKNYACVFSMAPLSSPLTLPACMPNYFGDPISLAASPWFRLFVAFTSGIGPKMLVLRRGVYLRCLPPFLSREGGVAHIKMFTWTLDAHPATLHTSNALLRINEELQWQPVMLLPSDVVGRSYELVTMPFPYGEPADEKGAEGDGEPDNDIVDLSASTARGPSGEAQPQSGTTGGSRPETATGDDRPPSPAEPAAAAATGGGKPAAEGDRQPPSPPLPASQPATEARGAGAPPLVPVQEDANPVRRSPSGDAAVPRASRPVGEQSPPLDPRGGLESAFPGSGDSFTMTTLKQLPPPADPKPTNSPSDPSLSPRRSSTSLGMSAPAQPPLGLDDYTLPLVTRTPPDLPLVVTRIREELEDKDPQEQCHILMQHYVEKFALNSSVGYVKLLVERRKKHEKTTFHDKKLELFKRRTQELKELDALFRRKQLSNASFQLDRGSPEPSESTPSPSPSGSSLKKPHLKKESEDDVLNVVPLAISFGIPVFDPELTKNVLSQAMKHSILSNAKMEAHSRNMMKLTHSFVNFVHHYVESGQPMVYDAKVEKSPIWQKAQTPVPFPKQSILFDGSTIKPYKVV